ncbi:MAG: hemerythrin family protein [Pseudomonadota bacterium]|nr:hemerythrin family protein [Pseudomonadota bacterium]
MEKIITWHDHWTLHIDTLDEDHHALVELLSDLARCFATEPGEGSGSDELADCAGVDLFAALEQLGAHAREHFRREEEFMRGIDYPGLAEHRTEHALLMAEYTELVRDLKEQGVRHIDEKTLETLKHWLIAHILGADRGFADVYFQLCGEQPGRR